MAKTSRYLGGCGRRRSRRGNTQHRPVQGFAQAQFSTARQCASSDACDLPPGQANRGIVTDKQLLGALSFSFPNRGQPSSLSAASRPTGPSAYFTASAPAFAHCPSCGAVPPDTPIAPAILPSTKIGIPPSIGTAP